MKINSKKDLENITESNIEKIMFDENINKEEMIAFLTDKYSNSYSNEENIFFSELLVKLLPFKMTSNTANKLFDACSFFINSFNPVFVKQAQKITDSLNFKKINKMEEENFNELEVKNDINFVKEYKFFQECLIDKENKDCLKINLPLLLEKASSYMLNLYKNELLDVLLNETEFKTYPSLKIIQEKINIYEDVVLFLCDKKCSILKKLNIFEFLIQVSKNVELKILKESFKLFLMKFEKEYFKEEIIELKIKQWIVELADCFCVEVDEFIKYFKINKDIF